MRIRQTEKEIERIFKQLNDLIAKQKKGAHKLSILLTLINSSLEAFKKMFPEFSLTEQGKGEFEPFILKILETQEFIDRWMSQTEISVKDDRQLTMDILSDNKENCT